MEKVYYHLCLAYTDTFESCPALYRCGHCGAMPLLKVYIFQVKHRLPVYLLFCIFVMNLRKGFVLKYGRLWAFVDKSTCVFSWTLFLSFSGLFWDHFAYPRNKKFAKRKLRLLQELETNFRRWKNFRLKLKSLTLPSLWQLSVTYYTALKRYTFWDIVWWAITHFAMKKHP